MLKISFFFLAILFCSGCNFSPLLNHKNAEDINQTVMQSERSVSKCKLTTTENKCQFNFEKEQLCATIEWKKIQNGDDPGEFYIFFWDPKAATASGPYLAPSEEKKVGVKLWMASMGHGSSPVQVDSCLEDDGKPAPGVYVAKKVYFIMNGSWEIWLQLKKDKIITEERKIDFVY